MAAEDRRIVPRKPYTMPIRFVVLSEELALAGHFQGTTHAAPESKSGLAGPSSRTRAKPSICPNAASVSNRSNPSASVSPSSFFSLSQRN
jgi:hypothetical protein